MRVPHDPPEEPPTPESIDSPSRAIASLVSSGDVGDLLDGFNAAVSDYGVKLGAYTHAKQMVGSPPDQALANRFKAADETLYKAGRQALDVGNRLIEQMRKELGARGELPADTSGTPV